MSLRACFLVLMSAAVARAEDFSIFAGLSAVGGYVYSQHQGLAYALTPASSCSLPTHPWIWVIALRPTDLEIALR